MPDGRGEERVHLQQRISQSPDARQLGHGKKKIV